MDSEEKTIHRPLLEELVYLRQRNADLETKLADHIRIEDAIRASETRYRRIFESAREGILILDAHSGRITDVNPFLIEMLGFSREELLNKRLREIVSFMDINKSKSFFGEARRSGSVHYKDLSLYTKSAARLDVEIVINFYSVSNKKVMQCNIRDITEHRKAEEQLKYLSTHDELTGLHNRMFFEEEMSRLSRGRQFPVTVIVTDVDGLKQVNDRMGHAAGDDLLRRAAAVLKETFRADEVVARLGGDEFVVLLPKTDTATAQMVLDRVRNKLRSYNCSQTGPALSLSLGTSTAKISQSVVEALKQADEHMYAEKAAHKMEGQSLVSRDLQLIFKQVDAKLSASPGIHISRLASELACERHVIERAVKVVKSMQFREYQQMRKFEMALHLLSEKPLLIKEIAGALGYTSPTSLWRLFKTRMRKGPRDIRALNRLNSANNTTNPKTMEPQIPR